jgi:ABC-type phosphate transport system substrate-binding protein
MTLPSRRRRLLLALPVLALARPARAGEIMVVCARALQLDAEDLKEIFLGELQFAGGQRVVPVDNAALQAEFLERVLRMSSARYAAWWTKKAFRDGVNPPPLRGGDTQVLAFVKETPGAIGYVMAAAPGVHVIGRF